MAFGVVSVLVAVIMFNRGSVSDGGFSFPSETYTKPAPSYIDKISSFDRWSHYWVKEPNRPHYYEGKCTTPTRKKGLCVSIYDCESMMSFFGERILRWEEREFLRLSLCTGAPSGQQPFVCCPGKTNQPTPPLATTPSTPIAPPVDPGSRYEVRGGTLPNPSKHECGVSIGMRIYGGKNADIDEFPWLAMLQYENFRGERKFSCGGSLINNRYVATAAHCVVGEIEKKEGNLVNVRLGEYDTMTEIDCIVLDNERICADPPVDVSIEEKLVHPGYSEETKLDDIALLRLGRDVLYTDFIQPICLPQPTFRSSVAGDVNFVTGFGRTLQGSSSAIKQKLGIKVYDQERCRAKFANKKAEITPKQLCAGGDFAKDSCHGDSGGPLMKLQKVWTLEGVVSFGNRCGLEDWPGVYTRVLAYMDWIRASVRN